MDAETFMQSVVYGDYGVQSAADVSNDPILNPMKWSANELANHIQTENTSWNDGGIFPTPQWHWWQTPSIYPAGGNFYSHIAGKGGYPAAPPSWAANLYPMADDVSSWGSGPYVGYWSSPSIRSAGPWEIYDPNGKHVGTIQPRGTTFWDTPAGMLVETVGTLAAIVYVGGAVVAAASGTGTVATAAEAGSAAATSDVATSVAATAATDAESASMMTTYESMSSDLGSSLVEQMPSMSSSVSEAVSKIAINTAMNGGDVKKAVVGYYTGVAGSMIGDAAAVASESDLVGTLADAGAKAAISHGDVKSAVLNAGFASSQSTQYTTQTSTGVHTMDSMTTDTGITSGTDASGTQQEVSPDGSITTYNADGSASQVMPDGTTYHIDASGNVAVTDAQGNVVTDSSQGPVDVPSASGSGGDISGWMATISGVSQQALGVVNAWKKVGSPPPRQAQPTKLQNGAIVTYNHNGTMTTRQPDGKSVTTIMPVGHPFTFPDGGTVVNNGDGTYTNIDSNGNTTSGKIPGTGGAGGIAALTIGAGLLSFLR